VVSRITVATTRRVHHLNPTNASAKEAHWRHEASSAIGSARKTRAKEASAERATKKKRRDLPPLSNKPGNVQEAVPSKADAVPADEPQPEIVITQILDAINAARTDPMGYARSHLYPKLEYFDGKRYREPGAKATLITQEGRDAVEGAIKALEKQRPLPPLVLSPGLCRAAEDLAKDHGPKGKTGHKGSDGSGPSEAWHLAAHVW